MTIATDPADVIAEAVQACPAVAALHGGRFGQVTTYLPGRRIVGVVVSADEIVVGVVGRFPVTVAELAREVRAAVAVLAPGVPVTVQVEDLLVPGDPQSAPPRQQRGGEGVSPMSPTMIGLVVGLALGFAAAFGGFGALAIVALLGVLGGWPAGSSTGSSTCPRSPAAHGTAGRDEHHHGPTRPRETHRTGRG